MKGRRFHKAKKNSMVVVHRFAPLGEQNLPPTRGCDRRRNSLGVKDSRLCRVVLRSALKVSGKGGAVGRVLGKNLMSSFTWAAITEYHRLWLINHRGLLFTVLEVGQSQIKLPADLVSGKSQLPVARTAVFQMSSHGGRVKELS